MKTFTSGARSSEESPRIDLIPAVSLVRQAARMAEGAASHGERNYEKGAADPVFIRDRKNHLVMHALAYLHGDESDDHLGAILANAGMLARLEELGAVPVRETPAFITNEHRTYDDIRNEAGPCPFCERKLVTHPGSCGNALTCKFNR